MFISLPWRHNERDGVSNHQPRECLFKRLFRRRSMKTPKPRVTGLCEGNSPVTGEFPTQRARNKENISFWWRHHFIAIDEVKETQWLQKTVLCVMFVKNRICWCVDDKQIHLIASYNIGYPILGPGWPWKPHVKNHTSQLRPSNLATNVTKCTTTFVSLCSSDYLYTCIFVSVCSSDYLLICISLAIQ